MSLINSTPRAMSLNALQNGTDPAKGNVVCGFDTVAGFEAIQRMANLFSASSIVPENYRSKGMNDYTSKGNCVIALDMALRMGANPLMVMQNLYVVHGRPAWSAQFLIATLNKSGKFSALRYAFQGTEGTDEWGCRAVATELSTGEKLQGPLVTIWPRKKAGTASPAANGRASRSSCCNTGPLPGSCARMPRRSPWASRPPRKCRTPSTSPRRQTAASAMTIQATQP